MISINLRVRAHADAQILGFPLSLLRLAWWQSESVSLQLSAPESAQEGASFREVIAVWGLGKA